MGNTKTEKEGVRKRRDTTKRRRSIEKDHNPQTHQNLGLVQVLLSLKNPHQWNDIGKNT
jgi:hypothetical protein